MSARSFRIIRSAVAASEAADVRLTNHAVAFQSSSVMLAHSSSDSNSTRSLTKAYALELTLTPLSAYTRWGYVTTRLMSAPSTRRDMSTTHAITSKIVARGARRFTSI